MLLCVQSKGYRRGPKLVACLYKEHRVVIHNLDTGDQKEIEINRPGDCASSNYFVAVKTIEDGLHLFSLDGILVHVVPDSTEATCVAFHSSNPCILAMGDQDGSVRMWNQSMQAYFSSFELHRWRISKVRFSLDGRLFLSSDDHEASIVTLDGHFNIASLVKLEGHTAFVNSILPLFSANKCVTCSDDKTIKVWDCETGVCLRTLGEHTNAVTSLAMHPSGQYFASGSHDDSVIIWSIETFEVQRRISFLDWVESLVFSKSDKLYVAVYGHGVMSCNALTGEVGPVIIPGTGIVSSLTLGMTCLMYSPTAPPTLVTPQYLHPSSGLHPHMHCGPCLHNTLCTWLCWSLRSLAGKTRACICHTSLWRLFCGMCSSSVPSFLSLSFLYI